jgi:hypothetical protein
LAAYAINPRNPIAVQTMNLVSYTFIEPSSPSSKRFMYKVSCMAILDNGDIVVGGEYIKLKLGLFCSLLSHPLIFFF